MIETNGDVTTIRPTPRKWYTGAAIFLMIGLMIPDAAWIFLVIALLFAGLASGKLQNLELSSQGIKSRQMWKTRQYAWSDLEDFKIVSYRTSLFTSTKMLAFTRKDKKDTFSGKASRFFGGGTDTLPLVGISPDEMMACIGGYQARAHMMTQLGAKQGGFGSSSRSAPTPQKAKSADKGSIGFGRPETAKKPISRPAAANVNRPAPRPKADTPVFGRQSPSTPTPKPARRKAPSSDPLVQEGGLFRKRRDASSL